MTDLDNGADLRERLDRAMADLTPPDLTAAVLSDGHRMRRRRRALTVVSGTAAAAVVGALLIAPSLDGSAGGGNETDVATQPSADGGRDKGSGLPSPGPDGQSPPFPEDPPGWWDMPASTMAEELAERLPEGVRLTDAETINTDRAPGEPKREMQGYLTAVLRPTDDGPGKVNMVFSPPTAGAPVPPPQTDAEGNVTMWGQGPTPEEMTSCDPDWVNDPSHCEEITDSAGDPIGRILDSTAGGVRSLSVELLTSDNGVVMINVANTLADKWPTGASPSADDVPLDLPTLRAIAEDPVWTSYEP